MAYIVIFEVLLCNGILFDATMYIHQLCKFLCFKCIVNLSAMYGLWSLEWGSVVISIKFVNFTCCIQVTEWKLCSCLCLTWITNVLTSSWLIFSLFCGYCLSTTKSMSFLTLMYKVQLPYNIIIQAINFEYSYFMNNDKVDLICTLFSGRRHIWLTFNNVH